MHHGAFYSPLLVPFLFYPKIFRNMLTDERLDENKMVNKVKRVSKRYKISI